MDEANLLFYHYNKSASVLAADLCSPNATISNFAEQSLRSIEHAKYHLTDWFNFTWHGERLYPIVVEPDAVPPLRDQVDEAIMWYYSKADFQPQDGFQSRAGHANVTIPFDDPRKQHISGQKKVSLTEDAERCLEQYYRKDYKLLQQIMEQGCKSSGCRDGLQSILDRRKGALTAFS